MARLFLSIMQIVAVVGSVLLPHRWSWPIACLIAVLVLVPHQKNRRQIVSSFGVLIFGYTSVLLLRTGLDPLSWSPWVALLAVMLLVRDQKFWTVSRRRTGTAAAVALSFLIIARPAWPDIFEPPDNAPGGILICIGDSLTAGVEADDGGTYVARLRERLPGEVINAGRANDRVGDVLKRLERDVLKQARDSRHAGKQVVALIMIGGNDSLDGTPRSQFVTQLDELVRQVSEAGARIVLVEVPAGILIDPYAGVYRGIAGRYSAVLVPESQLRAMFTVELLFRDWMKTPMTIDGIHLSPRGASFVADWLEPYVRRAMADWL